MAEEPGDREDAASRLSDGPRLPDGQVGDALDSGADLDSGDDLRAPSDLMPAPAPDQPVVASSRLTLHWRSLSDGLILALVVGGPCLLAAEGLHDRAGRIWLLPVAIAGVGFLLAGGVAGRHRRRPVGALVQGVAVAVPVAVLLFLIDLLYRVIGRRPITGHVLGTLLATVVGAVVASAIGALFGRWFYLSRLRQRRSPV